MIAILLANGFEESEALVPLDLLKRAKLNVKTISIYSDNNVTGAHGIKITADLNKDNFSLEDIENVILPGGMPGALNLDNWEHTTPILNEVLNRNGVIGAICAAPFVLGKRGILKDKTAVCFTGFENQLNCRKLSKSKVSVCGNVITACSMGVATEFGLEIVAKLTSREIANKIENEILKPHVDCVEIS